MAYRKSEVAKNPKTRKSGVDVEGEAKMKAEAAHQRKLAKRTPAQVGEAIAIIVQENNRAAAHIENSKLDADTTAKRIAACTTRMNKAFRKLVLRPAEIVNVMSALGHAYKNGEPMGGRIKTW